MKRIMINGRFLAQPITGVQRFAEELIRQLDGMCEGLGVELLVPHGVDGSRLGLCNIRIREVGLFRGVAWEQVSLSCYAFFKGGTLVNLCNSAPLLKPDVVCVHDMQVRANPSFYTRTFVIWYRMMYAVIALRARRLLTVSEFSRSEIERYYPRLRNKIEVVPNAWQHIERIVEDCDILKRYRLTEGAYYYSLSSMSPNKNIRWIVAKARQNPAEIFVISGNAAAHVFSDVGTDDCPNVIKTGRVTDGEAKALMRHCKAFLFPSIYEGFGIPPLEALSMGCPVFVSRTSSLPEIFQDAVGYLDPFEDGGQLPNLVADEKKRLDVLARYSWKRSAEKLASVLGLTVSPEG